MKSFFITVSDVRIGSIDWKVHIDKNLQHPISDKRNVGVVVFTFENKLESKN